MLFRLKQAGRDNEAPNISKPDTPLRLGGARPAVWAEALCQKRKAVRPALGQGGGVPYVWLATLKHPVKRMSDDPETFANKPRLPAGDKI